MFIITKDVILGGAVVFVMGRPGLGGDWDGKNKRVI